MGVLKYFERIKRMDDCIRRQATGSPEEFATKLGISRSSLMEYLKILRELNAPIEYDHFRGSYFYSFPCKLNIGFQAQNLTDKDLMSINRNNIKKYCEIILVQK